MNIIYRKNNFECIYYLDKICISLYSTVTPQQQGVTYTWMDNTIFI